MRVSAAPEVVLLTESDAVFVRIGGGAVVCVTRRRRLVATEGLVSVCVSEVRRLKIYRSYYKHTGAQAHGAAGGAGKGIWITTVELCPQYNRTGKRIAVSF
ncbi:hypothetical protein EVAR_16659_1 [Eumeta japonica]|uniref:Uncharacterized protein n=1 Tax=Eumeta variegata TaxID=151549 RepID=A0A4C1V1D6_EUMVA|nr:hypothetical protein EVAR_16659_1 [Eumeta japonica]